MPAAPLCPRENRRLTAVKKLRLLGTPAEERFDKITRLARRMFGVPMAVIDIVGDKLAWLKSVQGMDAIAVPREHSYCHYTVLSDEVCLVRDARVDPRLHDNPYATAWVFYAGVPLKFDGERVGVLCIGDNQPRDLLADELDALRDLAALAEHELHVAALSEAQIELALSNEELHMKSRVDVLTRVWNRGAILELAALERSEVASNGEATAFMMIDADHFKLVNDRHGHLAGDEALRIVAARLRGAVRPTDLVGRYGGEEFLVVLPSVSAVDALAIAERLRASLSSEPVRFGDITIDVTCSIGCAISGDARVPLDDVIACADRALYRAKANGRNRAELEPASAPPPLVGAESPPVGAESPPVGARPPVASSRAA